MVARVLVVEDDPVNQEVIAAFLDARAARPEFEDRRHTSAQLMRKIAGQGLPNSKRHRYTPHKKSLDK